MAKNEINEAEVISNNWSTKLRADTKSLGKNTWKGLKPLNKNLWVALLMVAVILAAQLALRWRPIVGVYVNAGALAVFLLLALLKDSLRQLSLSAAIIPTATMIMLSLPNSSGFSRIVSFYDIILVLGLVYRFIFTIDFPTGFTRLNFKGYAFALPLMIVSGQALGLLGYGMLRHHYIFGNTPLPMVAATVAVFALAEETLFRGLIQQRAREVMHPFVAGGLATLLFTVTSIGTGTYLAPLFSFILGVVLSYAYAKKQNLILSGFINLSAKLTYVGLMASFIFR
jgi:membrane protease YdiL (CAAX protease family)